MIASKAKLRQDEEDIRKRVRELPDAVRLEFFEATEKKLKDPDTYAALNYAFIAGLHHFYLGKFLHGFMNIGIYTAGIVMLFIGMAATGVSLILAISILEIFQLFRSQRIVHAYNNKIMLRIYEDIKLRHNPPPEIP
jgi:TM2 domain-containing membrane protein YozV